MNSNNNASSLKRSEERLISNSRDKFCSSSEMQGTGFSPAASVASIDHSYVSQPYNSGIYENPNTIPYSARDSMFANPTPGPSLQFKNDVLSYQNFFNGAPIPYRPPHIQQGILAYQSQSAIQSPASSFFPRPSYSNLPMLSSSSPMVGRFGPSLRRGYLDTPTSTIRPPGQYRLPCDRKTLGIPQASHTLTADLERGIDSNTARKKRKACGHCAPCQRKENCGTCMNCINRAKGKQICVYRKCEVLKKKPGSTPYNTTNESITTLKDKRKEIDELFLEDSKRSKPSNNQRLPADVPQGQMNPLNHPNFTEFGDITRGNNNSIGLDLNDFQNIPNISGDQTSNVQHQSFYPHHQSNQSLSQQSRQEFQRQALTTSQSSSLCESVITSRKLMKNESTCQQQTSQTNLALNNKKLQAAVTSSNRETSGVHLNQHQQVPLKSPQQQNRIQQQQQQQQQQDFSNWTNTVSVSNNSKTKQESVIDQKSLSVHPIQTTKPTKCESKPQELSDPLLGNLQKFYSSQYQGHSSPNGAGSRSSFPCQQQFQGVKQTTFSMQRNHSVEERKNSNQFNVQGENYSNLNNNNLPNPESNNVMYFQSNAQYRSRPNTPSQNYIPSAKSNPGVLNNNLLQNYGNQPCRQGESFHQFPRQHCNQNTNGSNHTNLLSESLQFDLPFKPPQPNTEQFYSNKQPSFGGFPEANINPNLQTNNDVLNTESSSAQTNLLPTSNWTYASANQGSQQAHISSSLPSIYSPETFQQSQKPQKPLPPAAYLNSNRRLSNPTQLSTTHNSMIQASPHSPNPSSAPPSSTLLSPASGSVMASSSPIRQQEAIKPMSPTMLLQPGSLETGFSNQWYEQRSIRTINPNMNVGNGTNNFLGGPGTTSSPSQKLITSESKIATNGSTSHYECNAVGEATQQAMFKLDATQPQETSDNRNAYHTSSLSSTEAPRAHGVHSKTSKLVHSHLQSSEDNKLMTEKFQSTNLKQHQFMQNGSTFTHLPQTDRNPLQETTSHYHLIEPITNINAKSFSPQVDAQSNISPSESGYDSADFTPLLNETTTTNHNQQTSFTDGKRTDESGKHVNNKTTTPAATPGTLLAFDTTCKEETKNSLLIAERNVSFGRISRRQTSTSLNDATVSKLLQSDADVTSSHPRRHSSSSVLMSFPSSSPQKTSDYQLKSDPLYSSASVKTPPSIVDPSEVGMKSNVRWPDCGKRSRDFKFIVPEMKRKRNNSLELIDQKNLVDHHVIKDENGCDVSNESSKTPLLSLDAFANHTFETPPATPCELQCLPSLDVHETGKCPSSDLRGKIVTVPGTNGSEARKVVYAQCDCFEKSEAVNDEAPYYTHLGAASDVSQLRQLFQKRTGFPLSSIRMEKIKYSGKEGKTTHGCPIAKWILRRSSMEERLMVICRKRPGHNCSTAVMAVVIVLWDGIENSLADMAYTKSSEILPYNAEPTERRCGINASRTCACQGFDEKRSGASFSFGCSWIMYYNGCKYARSTNPKKFKMSQSKNKSAEAVVENLFQKITTDLSRIYRRLAPDAHKNQIENESNGKECRIGLNSSDEGRPFSSVSCCMDFCAHSHRDQHNMDNGTTVVVTLTKPELRTLDRSSHQKCDEQYHVLPLYTLDLSDSTGEDPQYKSQNKINSGATEVLSSFRNMVRLREEPLAPCAQRSRSRKSKKNLEEFSLLQHRMTNHLNHKPNENIQTQGLRHLMPSVNQRMNCRPPVSRTNGHSMMATSKGHLTNYNQPYINTHQMPCFVNSQCFSSYNQPTHEMQVNQFSDYVNNPNTIMQQRQETYGLTPPPRTSARTFSPLNSVRNLIGTNNHLPHPPHFQQNFERMRHPFTNPICRKDTFINSSSALDRSELYTIPSSYNQMDHINQHEHINKMYNRSTHQQKPQYGSEFKSIGTSVAKTDVYSDSEENFKNSDIGGVAIAPTHGSVIIECSKKELHATTSLLHPNRYKPSRISLVYYQHKNLNLRNHGSAEYAVKKARRDQEKATEIKKESAEKEAKERAKIDAEMNSELFQPKQTANDVTSGHQTFMGLLLSDLPTQFG